MKLIKEFKEFTVKGNAFDMAIGVIIGTAFGKIITSIVNDVIMPLIGMLIGGINFTSLNVVLKEAYGDIPAIKLNYGNFIQVTLDFLIITFSIFVVIKVINRIRKPVEVENTTPTVNELLIEIRDVLKEKNKII